MKHEHRIKLLKRSIGARVVHIPTILAKQPIILSVVSILLLFLISNKIHALSVMQSRIIQLQAIACRANISNCEMAVIIPIALPQGYYDTNLYKVTTNNKEYIIKLFSPQQNLLQRNNEIQVMRIAAEHNIAPAVYWYDPNAGIVMPYVNDKILTGKELSNHNSFLDFAKLLRELHQLPGFPKTELTLNVLQREVIPPLKKYYNDKLPYKLAKTLSSAREIANTYNIATKLNATHNDLNPNNVLFDGTRFWLMDWDNAGLGDPLFDIATFSIFNIFNNQDELIFLEAYLQKKPDNDFIAKYNLMKNFAKAYYGLAYFETSFNYKDIAYEHEDLLIGDEPYDPLSTATPSLIEYLKSGKGYKLSSRAATQYFASVLINDYLKALDSGDVQAELKKIRKNNPGNKDNNTESAVNNSNVNATNANFDKNNNTNTNSHSYINNKPL